MAHLIRAMHVLEVCQHLIDDTEGFANGLKFENGDGVANVVKTSQCSILEVRGGGNNKG